MIPWFVVDIIGVVARLIGRDVYVRAYSDGWGAERVYLQPRVPGQPRLRRLKPHTGGALTSAEVERP